MSLKKLLKSKKVTRSLTITAVTLLTNNSVSHASGISGMFTGALSGVLDAVSGPIAGFVALIAGTLFFISLARGDGGSVTGKAFMLLIAIGGAIGWAGNATSLFSGLTTSGLGF